MGTSPWVRSAKPVSSRKAGNYHCTTITSYKISQNGEETVGLPLCPTHHIYARENKREVITVNLSSSKHLRPQMRSQRREDKTERKWKCKLKALASAMHSPGPWAEGAMG